MGFVLVSNSLQSVSNMLLQICSCQYFESNSSNLFLFSYDKAFGIPFASHIAGKITDKLTHDISQCILTYPIV